MHISWIGFSSYRPVCRIEGVQATYILLDSMTWNTYHADFMCKTTFAMFFSGRPPARVASLEIDVMNPL